MNGNPAMAMKSRLGLNRGADGRLQPPSSARREGRLGFSRPTARVSASPENPRRAGAFRRPEFEDSTDRAKNFRPPKKKLDNRRRKPYLIADGEKSALFVKRLAV
jgi:hypothetical protein